MEIGTNHRCRCRTFGSLLKGIAFGTMRSPTTQTSLLWRQKSSSNSTETQRFSPYKQVYRLTPMRHARSSWNCTRRPIRRASKMHRVQKFTPMRIPFTDQKALAIPSATLDHRGTNSLHSAGREVPYDRISVPVEARILRIRLENNGIDRSRGTAGEDKPETSTSTFRAFSMGMSFRVRPQSVKI